MYDTDIKCTYNTSEIFNETDEINEEEKGFIRDAIYRQEFLNIFRLEKYDENEMNNSIHELYERIKNCKELNECMIKLSEHFLSLDKEIGLMFLFSYDYMYIAHVCVCEYLLSGVVSEDNINKLKSIII